jgi:ABC-2 type transport system permease protein
VRIDVVGRKMRADSVGKETEVPMDDLVEIGVFAPYLEQHRIRSSGKQTISITVLSPKLREGGEPARAGIDPWHKLIDREREDNVVEVKAAGVDPAGAGS